MYKLLQHYLYTSLPDLEPADRQMRFITVALPLLGGLITLTMQSLNLIYPEKMSHGNSQNNKHTPTKDRLHSMISQFGDDFLTHDLYNLGSKQQIIGSLNRMRSRQPF